MIDIRFRRMITTVGKTRDVPASSTRRASPYWQSDIYKVGWWWVHGVCEVTLYPVILITVVHQTSAAPSPFYAPGQ